MARYDYKCPNCDLTFEVEHPMSEHPDVSCPACGTPAHQVFGATGIVFKGSGFYNTDQRSSGSKGTTAAPAPKKEAASEGGTSSSETTPKTEASPKKSEGSKKAAAKAD